VTDSILTLNQANGGGTGFGGGAFNDASSGLALTKPLVALNQATGRRGTGGGVYTLETSSLDALALIVLNHASTNGDNVGP
jgi:hypothetical protein